MSHNELLHVFYEALTKAVHILYRNVVVSLAQVILTMI